MTIVRGDMELAPNVSSDRSWVYRVLDDFSEGEVKPETLAIKFSTTESTLHLVWRHRF